MTRQLVSIFLIAFVLNVIWENFHSLLYVHYKGSPVTELILLRAALFDASVITLLSYPFLRFKVLEGKLWLMVSVAVIFAIGLEVWALQTSRWAYKEIMPIIPFIGTGLTPTIQLGLLAYLSFVGSAYFMRRGK